MPWTMNKIICESGYPMRMTIAIIGQQQSSTSMLSHSSDIMRQKSRRQSEYPTMCGVKQPMTVASSIPSARKASRMNGRRKRVKTMHPA